MDNPLKINLTGKETEVAIINILNEIIRQMYSGGVLQNKVESDAGIDENKQNLINTEVAITGQDLKNIENGIGITSLDLKLVELEGKNI